MKNDEFRVIETKQEIEAAAPAPGAAAMVVNCDGSLLLARDGVFQTAATGSEPLDIAAAKGVRVLADGVDLDDAWTINPRSRSVVLTSRETVRIIPLEEGAKGKTVDLKGLPDGAFGVAVNEDESMLLHVTAKQVDPDFEEYHVLAADLAGGRLLHKGSITSPALMSVAWSRGAGGFFVFDPARNELWNWRPPEEPAVIDRIDDVRSAFATFAVSSSATTIQRFAASEESGSWRLQGGSIEARKVKWSAPMALPDGDYYAVQQHPDGTMFACYRIGENEDHVSVIDTKGTLVGDVALTRTWVGNSVAWSADGTHVYVLGERALGIWRSPAGRSRKVG